MTTEEIAKLEDEVRASFKRADRWGNVYAWMTGAAVAVATIALWAFDMYREWVIWTR